MSGSAWFNSFLNADKADRPGGGGGGKIKIQCGRNRVPNVVYPRGGQQRFGLPKAVIRGRFVLNNKFANAALGKAIFYYSNDKHRDDKELERDSDANGTQLQEKNLLRDKTFFSRFDNDITPNDVQKSLLANKGERVAFHEMMISPGSNAIDLVDYTRHQMKALEDHLGHSLIWYGNVHRDTDHFHANVLIAGRIPDGREIAERAIEKVNEAPQRIKIDEAQRTSEPLVRDEPDEKLRDIYKPEGQDELVRDLNKPERQDELVNDLRKAEREDELARNLLNDGTDKRADELIDKDRSIGAMNVERAVNKADRAFADQTKRDRFNSKGDVYLTRECYQTMREAGNSYTRSHLEHDRVMDRTLERFDLTRENERERGDELAAIVADKASGNSDSLPDLFGVNTASDESQTDSSDESQSVDVTGTMTDFEPPDKSSFQAGDNESREREDDAGREFPSSRG